MAEAAQNRVQNAMKDFLEDIDRSNLRPIQRKMYLCDAECMADMGAGMEEVIKLTHFHVCKERLYTMLPFT